MLELIELIPIQERKKWIAQNLEEYLDMFQTMFNDFSVSNAIACENENYPPRPATDSLLHLEGLIFDLRTLKPAKPAKALQ